MTYCRGENSVARFRVRGKRHLERSVQDLGTRVRTHLARGRRHAAAVDDDAALDVFLGQDVEESIRVSSERDNWRNHPVQTKQGPNKTQSRACI